MIYGYARVSTDGQSVDTQLRRLRAAGARRVFREVSSGARGDRSQLRRAIAKLEAGDVLMVMRLDRLARSTRDLLNTLAAIAEKNAGFRSLGDVWADTTTPAFMAEHVYPNEEDLFAQVSEGDRWQPVPLLESLKARARATELCISRR
jgi:DNA invertase Pin-like site-specific DNA recombinase